MLPTHSEAHRLGHWPHLLASRLDVAFCLGTNPTDNVNPLKAKLILNSDLHPFPQAYHLLKLLPFLGSTSQQNFSKHHLPSMQSLSFLSISRLRPRAVTLLSLFYCISHQDRTVSSPIIRRHSPPWLLSPPLLIFSYHSYSSSSVQSLNVQRPQIQPVLFYL